MYLFPFTLLRTSSFFATSFHFIFLNILKHHSLNFPGISSPCFLKHMFPCSRNSSFPQLYIRCALSLPFQYITSLPLRCSLHSPKSFQDTVLQMLIFRRILRGVDVLKYNFSNPINAIFVVKYYH